VERKTSNKKYLLAFSITLVIFLIGIILGSFIDDARLNDAESMALEEKVNLRSLQLQQQFIESGIADCKTLNHLLEQNINELARKMAIVQGYDKSSLFNEKLFKLQLQDYFLTEIQFLYTAQDIDKKCKKDNIKILYFYDENALDTQGDILGYLKKLFGNRILVFSFNSKFNQEPMIPILLTNYKITQFPAVVIDDKVYQGHQKVDKLMDSICTEFESMKTDVPLECKQFRKNIQGK